MFDIKLQYEAKHSMDEIAKEFRGQLSETEINKTAAAALNITTRRVLAKIVREAQKDFTISNKYMERTAKMKPAGRDRSNLYTTLSYSKATIPAVAYKHTAIGSRGGVRLEVRKGKADILRHAFIATMRNNGGSHEGIFAWATYSGGKLGKSDIKTKNGRPKLLEVKSPSPFGMYTNERMNDLAYKYVDTNLPNRFRALLENKIRKMNK